MDVDLDAIAAQIAKQGNLEQFGVLFDAMHEKIYRFVYFRTHHKETAEDITSQIFHKTLEHIQNFNPSKASFQTWLYQIARNSLIDYYRTRKDSENIEDAGDLATPASLERNVDATTQLEKVKTYLQTLSPEQRDIVLMRVWDGLSHKEIAKIMGMSEANAKTTFSRVLAKLNKEVAMAALLLLLLR